MRAPHGPTVADLEDHDLPAARFDEAARLLASGTPAHRVATRLGLTAGQLAFVERYTGRPEPLFARAEQLVMFDA